MAKEAPGIAFEKVVSDLQRQFDPNASVKHKEYLIDRLGQKREFDVVIRGKFSGQDLLGIIECKDKSRPVGVDVVDGFISKSVDINANFKIIVSRRGFTKSAIKKAQHYGIQTLSVFPSRDKGLGFLRGTKWEVDLYRWGSIVMQPLNGDEPAIPIQLSGFTKDSLKINGKKIVDGFCNYMLQHHDSELREGWVEIEFKFLVPQIVTVGDLGFPCTGMRFQAERLKEKKVRLVEWHDSGFFDWQRSQMKVPGKTMAESCVVPVNFFEWADRTTDEFDETMMTIQIVARGIQFEHVTDAIELDKL